MYVYFFSFSCIRLFSLNLLSKVFSVCKSVRRYYILIHMYAYTTYVQFSKIFVAFVVVIFYVLTVTPLCDNTNVDCIFTILCVDKRIYFYQVPFYSFYKCEEYIFPFSFIPHRASVLSKHKYKENKNRTSNNDTALTP